MSGERQTHVIYHRDYEAASIVLRCHRDRLSSGEAALLYKLVTLFAGTPLYELVELDLPEARRIATAILADAEAP